MYGWIFDRNKGEEEGHTMFVEGYLKAVNKKTSAGLNVLIVFDGWYENSRCINYDFGKYTKFRGTFFHG